MYEWHGQGIFAMENVITMYSAIALDTVTGEFIQNYLKVFSFLLIWGKNLGLIKN